MRDEQGQILIMALIFLVVIIFLAAGLLGFVGQNVLATRRAVAGEQALQLADAGIEKAVWQLNQTAGTYGGETETALGPGEFDVSIADVSPSIKEITATGFVPSKASPRNSRTVKVQVSINTTVVNFNYGVQVGEGGLEMSNNAKVRGNVYSNGVIDGSNNARIFGDAFSAGPSGRITDNLEIDGSAYAHRIDNGVQIGDSAFGQDMNDLTVGGDVFTNQLNNCTVGGNASYTTINSCTVGGSETTGYPGEPDPEPQDYPITDSQITDWKNEAAAGGVISGDYSLTNNQQDTLGPSQITGDLTLSNGAILTLTGPLWVQGEIEISNNAILALDSSYGNGSEVVITDDVVDISNNAIFQGADQDSYILMISTASGEAFDVANNADALIIFVPDGEVEVSNNAILREITAWRIELSNGAEVIYESGLSNVTFTGGPGASWQIIRQTWREIK